MRQVHTEILTRDMVEVSSVVSCREKVIRYFGKCWGYWIPTLTALQTGTNSLQLQLTKSTYFNIWYLRVYSKYKYVSTYLILKLPTNYLFFLWLKFKTHSMKQREIKSYINYYLLEFYFTVMTSIVQSS